MTAPKTKTNAMPLIGRVTENDPIDRFSIGLKLSTRTDLEAYREYYSQATGDDIDRTKLIEELLRAAMRADNGFKTWKAEFKAEVAAISKRLAAESPKTDAA